MKMRDYPLEEQQRMGRECNYFGWGSFEEWIEYMADIEVIEDSGREPEYFTREEAEALIADITNNPEDKVGFAQRMAVDPDSVTAEKMIANIRARIRD